jgi:hypothetical protein
MTNPSFRQSWQKAKSYIRTRSSGGGWPYIPGHAAAVEATSWCAIALEQDKAAAEAAAAFLVAAQSPDGGWSNASAPDSSDWSTAPALISLRLLKDHIGATLKADVERAFHKGISFLLNSRADPYAGPLAKTLIWLASGSAGLEYGRGWPWTPGCFHWVEPTSYALIALKPSRQAQEGQLKDLIARAEKYLIEHACAGGGWNYGSHVFMSTNLPPMPVTSAVAVLALQDRLHEQTVGAALAYLDGIAAQAASVMTLSWCLLAFHATGRDCQALASRLVQHQQTDGGFQDNLLLTALASCALSAAAGHNPLKFAQQ